MITSEDKRKIKRFLITFPLEIALGVGLLFLAHYLNPLQCEYFHNLYLQYGAVWWTRWPPLIIFILLMGGGLTPICHAFYRLYYFIRGNDTQKREGDLKTGSEVELK